MKFCLTLVATVLLGAISLEAHAQQPWLTDRKYGEGAGIRVGNLEVHPGLSGEFGYDSNYFLRAPSEDPFGVYRIRVTPSVSIATLGPQRREGTSATPTAVTFRAGTYVAFNQLIAADSKHSDDIQDKTNVDLGADLALTLFPTGRVGVDAYSNFVRTVQPSNATEVENAFNRDSFRAGAGATWRPGGGLFDWRLGYEFVYNYFEKDNFSELNNYQNTVNMRGRWRFLPRTALLYDGSYTWISYPNSGSNTPVGVENDGQILRSRVGINGLITTRLSALLMVGWAGTFYDTNRAGAGGTPAPQQFDSVTGQAELKYYVSGGQETLNPSSVPVGLSYVSLGVTRDVANSYLGNFYQRDRVYAGVSYLLGGRFIATLNGGFSNIEFPTSFFENGQTQQPEFSEQRVDASLFTEYRLNNVFALNATVNYDQNITDVAVPTDSADPTNPNSQDPLKFRRWQLFAGARLFW